MTTDKPNGAPPAKDARRFENPATTGTSPMVQATTDGIPTVRASAYSPDGSRRMWALAYRCTCGHVHMGRARSYGLLGGTRRARCGRRVFVSVVRTYPAEVA